MLQLRAKSQPGSGRPCRNPEVRGYQQIWLANVILTAVAVRDLVNQPEMVEIDYRPVTVNWDKRVLIVWEWKRFTTELDEHWPIITFSRLCWASNGTFGLCGDAQANWCENC